MFEARFQSFDDPEHADTGPRIDALRGALARRTLSGLILPHSDRHQNEYVPPSEERLAWLTGFTGSAGSVIVLQDRAILFTDGRYTLQAHDQIDPEIFEIVHMGETPPHEWLEKNLPAGATLGYDPWLHTLDQAERLAKACATAGGTLTPTEPNPIDALWTDRPLSPCGAVVLHEFRYAGEYPASKLARVRAEIGAVHADALVVSDPHNLAWLFNIRGSDVAHTPLPLGFAIVPREERPSLYIESAKLTNAVRHTLEGIADIREPAEFGRHLRAMAIKQHVVRIDQATAADALARLLTTEGGTLIRSADPITLMKAVKNPVEIEGAREAHRRDGAAMVRFLAWFDREVRGGTLTEIDAVEALESFRRDTGLLKDVSFPTISGSGPNGAIVHYRVTNETNRTLRGGELFLLDSGAQYEDGTTDITRTIAVGEPSVEMRERFTLVLKGHIAIARTVFPDGITGAQLDPFARRHLWEAGLDYDHGTGHGVGSYLSVHEGPARISKLGHVPLRPGMILSNEPGYYKPDAYGIRIENLVLVIDAPSVPGADKPLNMFETLTLAPIDRRLIDVRMLNADEISWLEIYHSRIVEALDPLIDDDVRAWLDAATRPLTLR